ncbi:protein phosphatase regulator [Conoideocrella luteorostrata]|uniref:Protein phosphatase regulator n=1 Tax=Conoideocrella luteorostrata TaxID=1105319 RepID=A0AAJ0CZ77_9HYPO|nr:protein phosphatase regulator [Conoideocrella luteorostrata]
MTRPSIIRADTIDLQDPVAPSAKDHPIHPHLFDTSTSAPGSAGVSIAPHQAETLREIAQETAELETQSPRVSWSNGKVNDIVELQYANEHDNDHALGKRRIEGGLGIDMYHHEQQDALAVAQNGGVSSTDEDELDGESDGDLDDDMMDKISSSPSIEDGAFHPTMTTAAWPPRESSLTSLSRQLDAANVLPGTPEQASANCLQSGRVFPIHETIVTHLGKGQDIAEWQFRPDSQHRRHWQRSSERDECNDNGEEKSPLSSSCASENGWCSVNDRQFNNNLKLVHGASHGTVLQLSQTQSPGLPTTEDMEFSNEHAHSNDPPSQNTTLFDSYSDDECLLEPEDIDFEFVYALHTFVATVEGQANATKGDTMVLLDDSNSYWWLVRVVKDSSIGYLPAEHIETPTERLARLNKHRNIDLSATMLGDQAQKQKNSFKSIRRRRKTVAFAEPTYVDYSGFDYSTDDEDIEELFGTQANVQQQREQQQQQQDQQSSQQNGTEDPIVDETAKVEPLKTRPSKEEKSVVASTKEPQVENEIRSSEESLDEKPDGLSRSRNGTVRNTDSFFKDDSVETKKITLTPNLLRDDNASRQSSDSATKDARSGSSFDKMDRELVSDKEKRKLKEKDKKDKEKKSGGLRGFFSRKDKKKVAEEDDESFGKRSMDIMSESRDSEDRSVEEQQLLLSPDKMGSQRQHSKLQKAAPTVKAAAGAAQQSVELSSYLAEGRTNDVSNVPPASMRIVDPETNESQEVPSNQPQARDTTRERSATAGTPKEERSVISKLMPTRSTSSAGPDVKPQKTIKAKSRMELDASDSSEPEEPPSEQAAVASISNAPTKADQSMTPSAENMQLATAAAATTTVATVTVQGAQHAQPSPKQRAGIESNGYSSPVNANHPPALMVDTSSPEAISPEASPSPELGPARTDVGRGGSSASIGKEPTWDDTRLRAFFDESDHIRDLLVVVYDKSNVEPAGSDHPVVGGLFREQNAKLAEITTQLDNMLGDWLARKQRLRGTI